jgi:hypothetical protein
MQEFPNLSEARPTFTLPAGERARLERAFSEHLQTAAPTLGIRTSAALPCSAAGDLPTGDIQRRPTRFMPLDRTPAGGFYSLRTVHQRPSLWTRLSAWLKTNMA